MPYLTLVKDTEKVGSFKTSQHIW